MLQKHWFMLLAVRMYGLLTKCEVKMAGYWPSSFFVCLWTETKPRSINSQKMAPSCLLGQPITSRDLVHLARSQSLPYYKCGLLTKCEVKMALSCPLGQPITSRDLVHLARSRSWPYNKSEYMENHIFELPRKIPVSHRSWVRIPFKRKVFTRLISLRNCLSCVCNCDDQQFKCKIFHVFTCNVSYVIYLLAN